MDSSFVCFANGYIQHTGASFEEEKIWGLSGITCISFQTGTSYPMGFIYLLDNYGPTFIDSSEENDKMDLEEHLSPSLSI